MAPVLTIGTHGTTAGGYVLSIDNTVLAVGAVASEGSTPELAAFHAGAEAAVEQGVTAFQVYGIDRGDAMPPEQVVAQFNGDGTRFTPLAEAFATARSDGIELERDITTNPSAPVLNPVHVYSDAAYDHGGVDGQIGYVVLDGVGVVRGLAGRVVQSTSIRELEYTAALEAAKVATSLDRADELRFVTDNWQTYDALNPSERVDDETGKTGIELHNYIQSLRGVSIDVVHAERSNVGIADTLASMAAEGDVTYGPRR